MTTELQDGDSNWTGVDGRRDPGELEPGLCSAAVNTRFDDGVPAPRKGIRKLPWLFNPLNAASQSAYYPFANIYGVGRFNDPDSGEDMLLVAADYHNISGSGIYRLTRHGGLSLVTTPAETLSGEVTFEQCFNGVMCFRGEGLSPLYLKKLGTGFQPVDIETNLISNTGPNPTDGTLPIVPAKRGAWIGNRLWIPHSRDLLQISDYLNPTRYFSVRAQARINQGSADKLVAVAKFADGVVIAFKEQSIYAIGNANGDLSTMVLDELTGEYGCTAPRSIVNVGGDLWFLSNRRGIASITQTAQGILQGTDVPVSQPIQNLIDRINWKFADQACAAFVDNRVYFAVPLDDATVVKSNIIENATYDGGGNYGRYNLVTGRRYRWVKGANDTQLVNGTETLTKTGEFIAQGSGVDLDGTPSAAVTAQLLPVFRGVNNAILVYDFKTRRWAGHDEGEAIIVREFIPYTVDGRERLLFWGTDGYLNLYEDGAVDEVMHPEYAPGLRIRLAVEPPTNGDTLGFNTALGGELVTVNTSSAVNITVNWGAQGGLAVQRTNFWEPANDVGGFDPDGVDPWLAPSTFIERWGETEWRVWDTAGTDPTAFVTMTGGLLDESNPATYANWVTRIFRRPIAHHFITRGYRCGMDASKRFRQLQVNLQTWNPSVTITELRDGVEEEHTVVSNWTRDRTKYYRPLMKADFVATNVNGDYCDSQRQDYSLALDATGTVYLDGEICPDREQAVTARFRLRGSGRYVRLKFAGAQGRAAVAAAQVLAAPGGGRSGVVS